VKNLDSTSLRFPFDCLANERRAVSSIMPYLAEYISIQSTACIDVGFTVLQGDLRMQVLVEVVVTNSRSRTPGHEQQ
jgi:hypothetical protein